MKLAIKAAGLCGAFGFLVATYPAMFRNEAPVNILAFGLPAAAVIGMLGYVIGDIMSKPKGHPHPKGRGGMTARNKRRPPKQKPVTGEETFLDDVPASKEALPIESSKAEED